MMICITTHLHVCTCRPNVPSKTHLVRTQTILRAPATFHARHTAAHSASRGAALVQEEKPEKDWRIVQMIDACKAYYGKLWSKAELDVASTLLDDQCVHKDMIWGGKELTVGPAAMTKLVKETRAAYPDLVFDVKQVGVIDVNNVFVLWEGQATNLGEYHSHRPSYHASNLCGITQFGFNSDRSKITEITVYRQPFTEDKAQVCEQQGEEDMHTLHLARLHFEGKKKTPSG